MSKIYYKSRLAQASRELPPTGREVYININMNPDSMGEYSAELYIDGKFIYQSRNIMILKAFEHVSKFLHSNYETTYEEDGRNPPWG